jgi:hypothetical protein
MKVEKEPGKRVDAVVKALQCRVINKRDADITIKIRSGEVVEYTDTDIVRYKAVN